MDEDRITIFAETNFRDERKKFGIRKRNRRYHMYVVGKTGLGKSNWFLAGGECTEEKPFHH